MTTPAADWRRPLLERVRWTFRDGSGLDWGQGSVGGHACVVAAWDFAVAGGSFGTVASRGFADAAGAAVTARLPLLSLARSGGTRLQEGVAGLAGMPRAVLALDRLAAAGLPHLAVADQPTTGGVWVTAVSRADLRVGVAGAVVGFAGPRVVRAVTGLAPDASSHRAETAHAAGLLDDVVAGTEVEAWLVRALNALAPAPAGPVTAPAAASLSGAVTAVDRGPWEQVLATRQAGRPAGAWTAGLLQGDPVPLGCADEAARAWVGRLAGRSVVACVLGPVPGLAPGVAAFRLLERCAGLAGRLGIALLTVVDTPGAEPSGLSENAGLAPVIGQAMAAVLRCPSPTLGVLLGEGGSGGALAALATDRLWLAPDSYFAALVPEGAAAALRTTPEEAAALLRLRPADVTRLALCDGLIDPAQPLAQLATALAELTADPGRMAARNKRWG